MIGYDLGMHHAGVLLRLVFLMIVLMLLLGLVLVIRVLSEYGMGHRQRKCARDYSCNVFSHFVWL